MWLLVGFLLLVPFFLRVTRIALFILTLALVAVPQANTLWSPYNRIDLVPLPPPAGLNNSATYSVVTSHVWYQFLADLSPHDQGRYGNVVISVAHGW